MPEATDDIAFLPLHEVSERIRRGELSSRDVTRRCLDRIARLDPVLNAFVAVTGDAAMAQAAERDAELASGRWRGPLHGVPIAVKDNVDVAGVPTTAASGALVGRPDAVPVEDAPAVARLRDAGAVLLGKLNMHEFAFGTTSLVSHFGPVRNPWDPERIAGGSSGGSAAAVAAGLCYGAVGTDTGGSIRLPAHCCGIVGLKPAYGRVSARGVVPLSWSLDHVGPMARTVRDAALMLDAMAGYDCLDPASDRSLASEDFAAGAGRPLDVLRVGVIGNVAPAAEVGGVVDAAIEGLAALGKTVLVAVTVDLPDPDLYGTVLLPEMWTYHAALYPEHADRYGDATRRRMGSMDAGSPQDYITARREVELARRTAGRLFDRYDLFVLPTAPFAALRADECHSPIALPLWFTNPFNVLGLPAISVPCGFTEAGVPVGLQIVGPPGGEASVLALASAYEQAAGWHTRRPPLAE